MCYHTSQREKSKSRLIKKLGLALNFIEELVPVHYHMNGFEHGNVMVITQEDPEIVQLATWGLLPPHYQGDADEYWGKWGGGTLNTRDDKFFINNTWKDDAIEQNKCIVIVDGLYEPHHVQGSRPIPFFFQLPQQQHFGLLGIYTNQSDFISCSLLTTDANPQFAEIHNNAKRMPMSLHLEEREYFFRVNTEEHIKNEFKDYRGIDFEAWPVSRDVTNSHVKSDRTDITDKVDYPELNTLF